MFLHPKSREEYALARTERKSGSGYTGFTCYAAPDVTLEQDLLRRDLTINALAQDENGHIIDAYGGQNDLRDRLLRHISPAFSEDPLRVLRVARFAARYAHLSFRIADETMALMTAGTPDARTRLERDRKRPDHPQPTGLFPGSARLRGAESAVPGNRRAVWRARPGEMAPGN